MNLTFNCVSSGSSGNCYFLEYGDEIIFVDAGVPLKAILACADTDSFGDKNVSLFITHEHHDHVSGLKPFVNRFSPRIYASEGTAGEIYKTVGHTAEILVLRGGGEYDINGFRVFPFNINHDSAEPLGYRFSFGGKIAVFATDLGIVTKDVERFLCCCDLLILESNYEPEMLKNGKYPYYLKKRIESQNGHLSNKDAVKLLSSVCSSGLGHVFLAHVSEENNDYDRLEKYALYCREKFCIDTRVLRRDCPVTGIVI